MDGDGEGGLNHTGWDDEITDPILADDLNTEPPTKEQRIKLQEWYTKVIIALNKLRNV